jgi:two-component system, NarL family, response regulator LiaR
VSSTAAKPTCVLADDHPPVLESIARYLAAQGFRVVGRAANGEEAVALVETHRPLLAVLDARMPAVSGTNVIRRVARTTPQCSCVVYSGFADARVLTEALDAGARGFVLKDAALESLVRALDVVAGGGMYIDPALADALIAMSSARELGLTPRERDVLRLLVEGLTNQQIAERLVVSEHTVHRHVTNILRKLDLPSRTAAAAHAVRSGLLE